MEKEQIRDLKKESIIYRGEGSTIYRLEDKRLLKVASPLVFECCKMAGISFEQKILDTRARSVSEIVCPISAGYDGTRCVAYTMEEIHGKSLNEYDDNYGPLERSNLQEYFNYYAKIEEIVRKANKVGIVMPDLCTCDNIIFLKDGSVRFIDYDGLQLGDKDGSYAISTSLGNPRKYLNSPKFSSGLFRFTTELDKASLTMLMFLWIFNVDLKTVGLVHPATHEVIDYKYIFDALGIDDEVFMRKVEANLSTRERGAYLADDLHRIVQNYTMRAFPVPGTDQYIKRLIHK